MSDSPAPTVRADRIDALDIVRGFALLGILLMNIVAMGLPFPAYFNPTAMGEPSQAEFTTWFITQGFFEGSMRTLFTMLFGAGFIILLERLESRTEGLTGAKIYMRRIVLLFLLGVANLGLLAFGGDILVPYSIAGMFLLLFYKTRIRGLIIGILVAISITTMFNLGGGIKFSELRDTYDEAIAIQTDGGELTEEQSELIETYPGMVMYFEPHESEITKQLETYDNGWWAVAGKNIGELFEQQLIFLITFSLMDSLSGMLLGMIALRIGLLQGLWSVKRIAIMTGVALGIGIPINLFEVQAMISSGHTVSGFFDAARTYDIGRISLAFGWLGIFLLLCKSPLFGLLKASIGAVGRMALTNYLGTSLLTSVFFIGFGYYGDLARNELYYVVAVIWAINIVFSVLWFRVFAMGPMEWFWRAGTYGQWPKLFRSK